MHVTAGKGAPADPPLSTAGLEQARLMAAWLAKQQLDRIYTSINRFMVAGSGQRSVITLNEHHHLM